MGSLKAAGRAENGWDVLSGRSWAGRYQRADSHARSGGSLGMTGPTGEGPAEQAGREAAFPQAWECPGRLRARQRLVKGLLTMTDGGPVGHAN